MDDAQRNLLFDKAMDHYKKGRLDLALAGLNELVEASQGMPQVLVTFCALRAKIHQELGDARAARRDFQFTIQRKPWSWLASAWYYNFLIESRQMEEANREGLRYLWAVEDGVVESVQNVRDYLDLILTNLAQTPTLGRPFKPEEMELIRRRGRQVYQREFEFQPQQKSARGRFRFLSGA